MTALTQDEKWVSKHFGQLTDLYGGRYVAVVNRRVVAVGADPRKVEKRARALTGSKTPSVVGVPRKGVLSIGKNKISLFALS